MNEKQHPAQQKPIPRHKRILKEYEESILQEEPVTEQELLEEPVPAQQKGSKQVNMFLACTPDTARDQRCRPCGNKHVNQAHYKGGLRALAEMKPCVSMPAPLA